MRDDEQRYETPIVQDYGDLREITAASGFFGNEDGGSKASAFHHTQPSTP